MALTHEQFVQKINKKFPNQYTFISEYKGYHEPITYIHNKCGKEFTISSSGNIRGKCKFCDTQNLKENLKNISKKNTKSLDDFYNLLKEEKDEYKIIDDTNYQNSKSKIILKHIACGHEYPCSYNNFQQGKRCPDCAKKKRSKILNNIHIKENYLENMLLDTYDGNDYQWQESYKNNNKEYHKIKHLKCNRIYNVRPNDFQQGYRCPFCSTGSHLPRKSKCWFIIDNILNESKGNLEYEFMHNDCKDMRRLPFDFKYNNTIIEYDGSQHFKLSCMLKESKSDNIIKHDQIKNNFILNSNYDFIRLHYKLKENDIREILSYIVEGKQIPEEIINKYKILVKQNNKIYNEKEYYNNLM